jgi:hypothetical protein
VNNKNTTETKNFKQSKIAKSISYIYYAYFLQKINRKLTYCLAEIKTGTQKQDNNTYEKLKDTTIK